MKQKLNSYKNKTPRQYRNQKPEPKTRTKNQKPKKPKS
jgi:hypothetical protein